MAKSGAWWSKDPSEFGVTVSAEVYKLTKQSAEQIFQAVVSLSPVDSGAYRASWDLSEDYPTFKWVGRHRNTGSPLPPPTMNSVSSKFYRKLFVSNGAPYAGRIEDGWSHAHAPGGVMREAMRYVK